MISATNLNELETGLLVRYRLKHEGGATGTMTLLPEPRSAPLEANEVVFGESLAIGEGV